MKLKKLWLPFGLIIFTISIAHAGDSPARDVQRSDSKMDQGHSRVIGTISKTTQHMLTLETEKGTTRNFTVKSAEIDGVTKLQPGDRVLLELDEGNQIIGIQNMGEKHQLVHGKVMGIDRDKKTVTLKFKDGTSQSYGMKEAMAGKMNNIEKGAVVTLMIDQHNNLTMDVHVD